MAVSRRTLFLVVALIVIAAATWTMITQPAESTSSPTATLISTPRPRTPLAIQLESLAAGGEVAVAGYARDEFGDGWKDTDHNGCDSRNDILARDLTAVTFRAGTHDCIVSSGVLADPYSGTTIRFVRGEGTSEAVQIDHLVPLSWAWSHGAADWTSDQRITFANDPINLRAVDGPTNGSKSDSGPAEWMPPAASYACDYVEQFLAVLVSYRLAVDEADRAAMRRTLAACA